MYAIPTAADRLGVTPGALRKALDRGETIANLTRACGLDPDEMTLAVIDAEVADVEALALISGFDDTEIALFVSELRAFIITFVWDGEAAANARFDAGTIEWVGERELAAA
ncbi:hypothetical protein CLV30_101516 [Haloactinopolyspora alba]|uniref:Uncharacterized protein n=1 Tax=Haloactinopolyspora alba TaxID=648780 RepID=A0A2P8EGF5_9ACTN|nr:hypothetical protein [Haloactinopolyspora alba]PSL08541.1 hypothetical protein CLV30_101516 [Haloactinopolyspora alba]